MTVDQLRLPFPNSAWPWPARQSGAAECRPLSAKLATPADGGNDDDPRVPLVSPPPLIPRIYPGL
jgi:hypothetical protein